MAFPTIPTVAAGRVLFQLATNPAGTHTSPSLSSLTKNAGDLLIAIVIIYDGDTTDAEFSSWGGSFTEFGDFCAAGGTMAIGCAYKWSDGSETGTFTVASVNTSSNDSCFILLSIPGAHASTPPEAGSFATGTGTNADPPAFGPAGWGTEDTLWIEVIGSGETGTGGAYTGIAAATANYTDYAESGISADVVGGVEGAVAFRQLNANDENVGQASVDLSNARNAALVIAVRPAAVEPHSGSAAVTGGGTGVAAVQKNGQNTAVVTAAGAVAALAVKAALVASLVAGAGQAVAVGQSAREAVATVSGAGIVVAVGGQLQQESGSALVSGAGDLSGVGQKGAESSATAGGAGGTQGAGQAGFQGAAVVSGDGDATAVGTSDRSGTAQTGGAGNATAVGASERFGTAGVGGAGDLQATGAPSDEAQVAVSGAGQAVAVGSSQRSDVATVSGGGQAVASGQASAATEGQATVSGAGAVSALGAGGRSDSAAVSGDGEAASQGSGQRAVQPVVSSGGAVVASGAGDRLAQATGSGGGATTAQGAGQRSSQAVVSGAGQVTAFAGAPVLDGEATVSGAGGVVVSGEVDIVTRLVNLALALHEGDPVEAGQWLLITGAMKANRGRMPIRDPLLGSIHRQANAAVYARACMALGVTGPVLEDLKRLGGVA